MKHTFKVMAAIATVTALLLTIAWPAAVTAQTTAAPLWGVPGSTFTFVGSGFEKGSSRDKADPGEQIAYWINTPDGRVIDTVMLTEKDKEGRTEVPMQGRAHHDGTFIMTWKAPANSITGNYTFVAHGMSSKHEQIIPFTIRPQADATSIQYAVTPTTGKAGTAFYFSAQGFDGGRTKDDPGEKIAYWINLPDGRIISTVAEKEDDEQAPMPLLDRARHDGTVRLVWVAPADAPAGNYSLVMHGLDTQLEVVLPFTVQ